MINTNVLLVIAMSRSGHHSIIDWVYAQFNPEKFFFNYCDFSKPETLFADRVQYHYNTRKYYSKISDSWIKHGLVEQKLQEFTKETPEVATAITHADKNLLIMNFENLDPAQLPIPVDTFLKPLGTTQRVYCVLILRDIYNFLASRIKSGRELTLENIEKKDPAFTNAIETWKSHAREFLNRQNNLPYKIAINFNAWFSSAEYRKKLSDQLHVDTEIFEWNTIASYGGGSSFDALQLQNNASAMRVLERWKEYWNIPVFRTIFTNDPELVELSEKIFGKIVS